MAKVNLKENIENAVIISVIVLVAGGVQCLINLWSSALDTILLIPGWINTILISVNDGEGFLPTILSHRITYYIVGVFLGYIPFNKKVNSKIGKILYWLVSVAIAPVLIWLNNIIFK